ncbi:MAG: helix-turn-helix transcriptional regulator [Firmicutes bacterium]|nr:helix-turn-helix transcriptional regulator [Bacillota bacterium]
MDQIKIGKFLQDLRKKNGYTQEQLAEKVGVSRRTVSRWETGSNMPDLDILIDLSDLYEVPLRELLDGERKSEKMDKEMEETVLKVAEYSNEEKKHSTMIVRIYFIIGIIALFVNGMINLMEVGDTFWIGFVKGITFGLALGAMILGILYTTGVMGKIYAFKMRLLHGGKEG